MRIQAPEGVTTPFATSLNPSHTASVESRQSFPSSGPWSSARFGHRNQSSHCAGKRNFSPSVKQLTDAPREKFILSPEAIFDKWPRVS
jgi:hypothetical protein